MKVYIKDHCSNAGKWIYRGYFSAWNFLKYEPVFYNNLKIIKEQEYMIMSTDSSLSVEDLDIIGRSKKSFIFVQPNFFPDPWGKHPNFSCSCSNEIISTLNKMENVILWTFLDVKNEYYKKWKQVHTIPLAYDSINYKHAKDKTYQFDVCFIGGIADNGFNEKHQIMLSHFNPLYKSDLKCGLFINKNLTHEEETKILYNSKVSINIHDAYQRKLGLDSNERTFKSLGLNGCLVSDEIDQISRIFPDIKMSSDPDAMLDMVKHYVLMENDQLKELKNKNRDLINKKHTYIERVKELLEK